ncbi:MAG: DUF2589 domain-containing protein [Hallella sp.]|nr:DUF2589 domain-containing protein [Hallella sp.]
MPQSRVTDPKELQKSPLGELDFNRIIGGPLSACVNAQEEAAQATLDYLNGVVFRKKDDDDSCLEPVTMTFYFESGGVVNRLTMPLLCIVPVPYLRIDQVNLRFQATVTESSMKEEKLELKAKYSAPGDSAEITDVAQEKFLSKRCIDVDLNVTTADMPMGISKLIEIFNNQLVEIKQYEPAEPALPTAPTEPIAPAEPEKPIEPAEPIEPEKPEPNYNIQLLTKVSKSQKADIINAINSTIRTGKPITAATLNNILKSEKKTIPIETTQATAKAIVQTLKRKNIAAIMVEV